MHGTQHKIHGGAFGCSGKDFVELVSEHDDWDSNLISFLGLTLGDAWTLEATNGPDHCDIESTSWEDCRNSCPYADTIPNMTDAQIYTTMEPYLKQWSVLSLSHSLAPHLSYHITLGQYTHTHTHILRYYTSPLLTHGPLMGCCVQAR